jgi:hydroxymethylpyrimidine pyrophosphatase-like HAD family hydrolase
MIKGIILDVDGVLIGNKPGYNWPMPNPKVMDALKNLRQSGIFVCLCTGKGTFSIRKIVEKANLDNIHIGDGGAVAVDFINRRIFDKHFINSEIAGKLVFMFRNNGIYVEAYTTEGYLIEKKTTSEITQKHSLILGVEPGTVKSLPDVVGMLDIVKVMPIARDEKEKKFIIKLFEPYRDLLTLQWGVHPTALPYQFGIITAKNISKSQAVRVISRTVDVQLDDLLGVGDSDTDWEFIKICGYKGVMGNGSPDLKANVGNAENGYLGKSVNENGVLDIFSHFGLKY